MLTPEYLLHVSEGGEEIASQLHTRILKKMVSRILARKERGDDYVLTAIDKWQLQTLQDAGYLLGDIQKELAEYTGYEAIEIARAFEDAGVAAIEYDDKIYKDAGIPTPPPLKQSPHMIRLMQATYEKTMGTWENFTGTTANSCHQQFINAMDEVYTAVLSGEVSYTQAYQDIIDRLCGNGLTITYPSGHADTLETAALRCIRTGVAQATAQMQLARMEENGDDLVLVSSHMGARPSHQEWQGQIYSLGGDDHYPDFYEHTHYGEGNGLCGWNCRHHFSVYIEGMDNPYEGKDWSNEENVQLYEDTQEQRRMERGIRKTKRAIEGYNEAVNSLEPGDPVAVHSKEKLLELKTLLKEQNAAYKAYCEEKGFRPLPERLKIAKPGRMKEAEPEIIEVKPPRNATEPPPEAPEPPRDEGKPNEPIKIQPRPKEPPQAATEPPKEEQKDPFKWEPGKKRLKVFGYMTGMAGYDVTNIAGIVNKAGDDALAKTMSAWADTLWYKRLEDERNSAYSTLGVVKWGYNDRSFGASMYTTLAHEMGHGCDHKMDSIGHQDYSSFDVVASALNGLIGKGDTAFNLAHRPSQSDDFYYAMMKDIDNLYNGDVAISKEDGKLIENAKDATGISDFLDGIFMTYDDPARGKLDLGFEVVAGHGNEYYNRKADGLAKNGNFGKFLERLKESGVEMDEDDARMMLRYYETASELWANIQMAITVKGDKKPGTDRNLYLLEKYCPNAVAAFREIMEDHASTLDEYRAKGVKPEHIEAYIKSGKKPEDIPRKDQKQKKNPVIKVGKIFEEANAKRERLTHSFKAEKDTAEQATRIKAKFEPENVFHPTSEYFGQMTKEEMGNLISNCRDQDVIRLYNLLYKELNYVYDKEGIGANYNFVTDTVRWAFGNLDSPSYSALTHEMGHGFDWKMMDNGIDSYGAVEIVRKCMNTGSKGSLFAPSRRPSQSDTFMSAVNKDMAGLMSGRVRISDEDKADISNKKPHTDGFADFLDGVFGIRDTKSKNPNIPDIHFGHGEKYYNRIYDDIKTEKDRKQVIRALRRNGINIETEDDLRYFLRGFTTATELWANINSAISVKADDKGKSLKMLKKYCHNSVEAYKELVKDYLKHMEKEEGRDGRQT